MLSTAKISAKKLSNISEADMKKVILLILCALFAFTGCAKKKPRLSMEEEYRMRQQRRMREAKQRREDKITSLSGLNSVELDELERSKKENDLNPNPGSFVYSPREQKRHGGGQIFNELNEDDRRNVKEYEKSVRQKQKSTRSSIYGI